MFQELPPPQDYRLWRFSIISPLLCRGPDDPPLNTMMHEISQKSFLTPRGDLRCISHAAIREWYYRYISEGIDALGNKVRCDKGTSSLSPHLQTALRDLRNTHPQLTTKKILEKLKNRGLWNGRNPGKSAMYRFVTANKLNRAPAALPEPVRPFEFPHFGNLWSADFLHGPKVRIGRRMHKSYLNAIIDDATRYIVAASFHLTEGIRSFLSDFLLAIRRFGIPQRLYTDNGAAYRSRHLAMVCAKLSIAMPHTPPYKPRGRGKGERFFRTVREGFLDEYETTSLKQLNNNFIVWLNGYHNTTHNALGMTPLNRKLIDEGPALKHIPPTQNINDIFRMKICKKVGADGCIRMLKKRFEVRDALPGEKIAVYYLPWDTDYVLTGPDKLIAKVVDTQNNAHRYNKPKRRNHNQ